MHIHDSQHPKWKDNGQIYLPPFNPEITVYYFFEMYIVYIDMKITID